MRMGGEEGEERRGRRGGGHRLKGWKGRGMRGGRRCGEGRG